MVWFVLILYLLFRGKIITFCIFSLKNKTSNKIGWINVQILLSKQALTIFEIVALLHSFWMEKVAVTLNCHRLCLKIALIQVAALLFLYFVAFAIVVELLIALYFFWGNSEWDYRHYLVRKKVLFMLQKKFQCAKWELGKNVLFVKNFPSSYQTSMSPFTSWTHSLKALVLQTRQSFWNRGISNCVL